MRLESTMRVRVLVADDDPDVRDALVELIASSSEATVAGVAGDAEDAIDLVQEIHPDVALLDVRMPGGGGPRAVREIRRRCPETAVVALSAYSDQATVLDMLKGGAASYLSKRATADEIILAIRNAANGVSTFSPDVETHVAAGLARQLEQIEHESEKEREGIRRIREAISGGEPSVVFQPMSELASGAVVGFEALARFMVEPDQSPSLWFSEAAAVGLLVDLEIAAVSAALGQVDKLPPDTFLSLNVSPEAVNSRRLQRLLTASWGRSLMVEVSEQAPVRSHEGLLWSLRYLHESGVRICVDDAGTGMQSLRRISQLKPDFIKLDVTLTRDVERDETCQAIVSLLRRFGDQIGTTLVAKSIETDSELAMLARLGIQFGQGFHLGRPEPIDTIHG